MFFSVYDGFVSHPSLVIIELSLVIHRLKLICLRDCSHYILQVINYRRSLGFIEVREKDYDRFMFGCASLAPNLSTIRVSFIPSVNMERDIVSKSGAGGAGVVFLLRFL